MSTTFWTQEAVFEAVRHHAAETGEPPTTETWKKGGYGRPSSLTVRRAFPDRSFAEVVAAAGVSPRQGRGPKRYWTENRIADAMLDWLLANGRWPTQKDWFKSGGDKYPTEIIVRRTFGTWKLAKLAAGWLPECQVCDALMPDARSDQKYCSRACNQRAQRRKRHGLPVNTKVIRFPDSCSGCGCDLDVYSIGCKPCGDRRRKRVTRAASGFSAARRLAAVEPSCDGAVPASGRALTLTQTAA